MTHEDYETRRKRLRLELYANRQRAHATLFAHRHENATPLFHLRMIDDWHSAIPKLDTLAFRGGAKSTIGEEGTSIRAGFMEFRNLVIIGSTSSRAIDRLRAIKHEIEHNELYIAAMGDLGGTNADIWNEDKVVLNNGVCLQAFGRNQSFRGVKHLDQRPDELWIDDLEEEEHVKSPEAFKESLGWLLKTVFPGCTPNARVRMTATPLAPVCIPLEFEKASLATAARGGDSGWVTRRFPVEYIDANGDRAAMWPDRFPLDFIDRLRADYEALGELRAFLQEYMLDPSDPALKAFKLEHIRVVPHVRTYHPVYATYDPARLGRTATKRNATTGKAVFSWIGQKLLIWEGGGYRWTPTETVNDMFDVDARYAPIEIGVEQTGLEEYIREPIRNECLRRNVFIPIRPLNPPQDKLDFIRSLQPFFESGNIEFACDLPDARAQLLGFPTGAIDFPNALAYALRIRPGAPVYENFNNDHVTELLRFDPLRPSYFIVNATQQVTVMVLVQVVRGGMHILADMVAEGDPGTVLAHLAKDMLVFFNTLFETRTASMRPPQPSAVCPPWHFAEFDAVGLAPAARRVPIAPRAGGSPVEGREELRAQLTRLDGRSGRPLLQVVSTARWTINGLAGGYARRVDRRGVVSEEAENNVYKVVLEGIESFAGSMHVVAEDDGRQYDTTPDGRRFLTMRGVREPIPDVKLPNGQVHGQILEKIRTI